MLAGGQCKNRLFWELSGSVTVLLFESLWTSQILCCGGCHVTNACTLRKTSRTLVEVHTSYGTGNNFKSLEASEEKALKILTFQIYQELVKVTVMLWKEHSSL